MKPHSVLFDLDNTLTHRRQSVTAFAHQFWADFQSKLHPIDFPTLENLIQAGDGGGYRPKAEMFALLSTDLPWREPMSSETMRRFWYQHSSKCMTPRQGMMAVLDTLRQYQIPIGIITNGHTTTQNATINALGIRHYFDVILISEAVGSRKPDRQIFEMALQALESKAEITWFVGDNPTSDIGGARNVGLRTVWVSDGPAWENELPPPEYQIAELIELLDIVELKSRT
jgi:putative hydrolase of the HAD superfamily